MTTGWLDLSGGVSGDMLLGACLDAGVPVEVVRDAVDRLDLPEPITITPTPVLRSGIAATHAVVEVGESHHHRGLSDVLALLQRLDEPVRSRAGAVFELLARAEAQVHGVDVEQVHFHEVGALDSIADVVGVVTALHHLETTLGLSRLVAGPIALGGGRARTEHGSIPVPGPATLELLRAHGVPAHGGPLDLELATPTGVALVAAAADEHGPMPALAPEVVGTGAGTRDPEGHANVLRLVVGTEIGATGTSLSSLSALSALPLVASAGVQVEAAVVLEANVDDLDPRLWPGVLAALMAAGASDAWLTPIVMKKGRPAHTVSVLCPPAAADALARVVLTHTSTIGLRRRTLDKLVLDRSTEQVDVLGQAVRVKLAHLAGEVVNASVEHDDVVAAATALGLPEKTVLAQASRAVAERWPPARPADDD
ncbi:nickel pincer cofactor biosynthesis protein LarC [Nocardioides marinquilinus]|uniref:Pyridinium-3,5-bisthiocarboxylic acid mononucleotide nickel insertion protein n=2 Tax=Nocardioides marinquilinus TaxID=1210400 RepID=A0ABP9Q2V9_9ACTN